MEKDFAKKIVNPYQIIFFWFGHDNPEQIFPMSKVKIWEGSPDAVQFMRQNFMSTYEAAATGKLNHWQNHPESLLALIILLDQFPRKVYAGQSKMFATDNLALGLVLEGIKTEKDLELTPVQRLFFYMPLQRSESPLIQKQSVKVYEKLYQDSAESIKPFINEFLNLAKYNKKNIDEYGKFAHRDKILNRHKPLNNLN